MSFRQARSFWQIPVVRLRIRLSQCALEVSVSDCRGIWGRLSLSSVWHWGGVLRDRRGSRNGATILSRTTAGSKEGYAVARDKQELTWGHKDEIYHSLSRSVSSSFRARGCKILSALVASPAGAVLASLPRAEADDSWRIYSCLGVYTELFNLYERLLNNPSVVPFTGAVRFTLTNSGKQPYLLSSFFASGISEETYWCTRSLSSFLDAEGFKEKWVFEESWQIPLNYNGTCYHSISFPLFAYILANRSQMPKNYLENKKRKLNNYSKLVQIKIYFLFCLYCFLFLWNLEMICFIIIV